MYIPNLRVYFTSGYNGTPKCTAEINDKRYVIDVKDIKDMLEEQILSKGFIISKTNRQKYERLVINK